MTRPAPASSYLPHLNGLRALAITGVLLYHLNAAYCPAGYFGVDVFLILSGFLLLRGMLEPGAAQRFRYGSFLQKKAWRILPAWFATTLVTCVVALLIMHPAQVGGIMQTAAYSAVFLADCFIDHSGDYFNPLSQQNPLLHFWYLSITEQLYLMTPLLIIPLARALSRRAALILLALLALLSFCFYVLTSSPSTTATLLLQGIGAKSAYYHLVPRFWEVAAGAGVFMLPEFAQHPRCRAWLGGLSLLGVAASFYLYATGSPAIYLTVISAMLAIRYAGSGGAGWLLSRKPVQALGTISFSLYLWHWPLMVFWKYCRFDSPTVWDELGMLATSLLLGWLGWRCVERFRMPARAGWAGFVLRASLLLCLPLVFFTSRHMYQRSRMFSGQGLMGHTVLIHHPVIEKDASALRGLEALPRLGLIGKPLLLGHSELSPSFLLIGDSHAQHLYDALNEACLAAGVRGIYLNNTVSPYQHLIQPQVGADTCRWDPAIAQLLLDYLDLHPEITHVLVAQCWQMRMMEGYALDGRTGQALTSKKQRMAVTGPGLGGFCDQVREHGRQVVLLGETPRFSRPYPLEEWHRRNFLGTPQRERRMSLEDFERRHAFPLGVLRQLDREQRAHLIELTPALQAGEGYPANDGPEFWYYDANHFTPAAAHRVIRHVMPQLQELLKGSPAPLL